MSRRSGFAGVTKLRRTLRRVDPEITSDLKSTVERGAAAIARDMAMMAPRDDGDLSNSIAYKMGRDKLTAIIGPGADRATIRSKGFTAGAIKYTKSGNFTKAYLKDKHARFQLYKALWLEFGTKAGKKGSSPTPARPFIAPAMDMNRSRIIGEVNTAINKALKKVSGDG